MSQGTFEILQFILYKNIPTVGTFETQNLRLRKAHFKSKIYKLSLTKSFTRHISKLV